MHYGVFLKETPASSFEIGKLAEKYLAEVVAEKASRDKSREVVVVELGIHYKIVGRFVNGERQGE